MYQPTHVSNLTKLALSLTFLFLAASGSAQTNYLASTQQTVGKALPPGITEIMNSPRYAAATWSLLVVDLESGETVYELAPDTMLFTGSVRKTFSVGFALNELGGDHRFETPIYRRGTIDAEGVLEGDLILVASGDLTLGGRTLPDGTVAFTPFDHNEANSLEVATLTETDPLTGIRELAAEVAASGITKITGEVIVDDRLFESFRVPNGNVLITPIIINDNRIDITVTPTTPGEPALVTWRPQSVAFEVEADVMTVAAGEETDVTLTADTPGSGTVSGAIAADYAPPVPGVDVFVRTFTIEDPSSYARAVLIEALVAAGVTVTADPSAANPSSLLPAPGSYSDDAKVATFLSPPYAEYVKLILKVSHNLGANLSLMLGGLAQGATDRDTALAAERTVLTGEFGIDGEGFSFPTNGSGSPDSEATARTIVAVLSAMQSLDAFEAYREGFPKLGVDGSLASIGVDSPAKGKVYGKTGTMVVGGIYQAQVLAGYIDAKSGKRLAFAIVMNDIGPFTGLGDAIAAFEAEGQIATVIYEDN